MFRATLSNLKLIISKSDLIQNNVGTSIRCLHADIFQGKFCISLYINNISLKIMVTIKTSAFFVQFYRKT